MRTENNFYSAHEDLTVNLDLNVKLANAALSTPLSIIEKKMSNHNIKGMNKINYHHINSEGMKHIHKIVNFIQKIEKDNKVINSCETEQPDHCDVSSWCLALAKIEYKNDRNELAVFCKFISE